MRLSLLSCLAAILVTASAPAFANATADECIDANSKAQLLRRSGRLEAAREQLGSCVDSRCPAMVRDDCAQRLDELNRAQPTIVFDGRDAAGNDVIAATVTVDGHPLTDRLDGSPLNVDPGPHTFEFAVGAQPRVTRTWVLKEGEKGRVERVVLGGPVPARAPPPASEAPPAALSPAAPPGAAPPSAPPGAAPPAVGTEGASPRQEAIEGSGWGAGKVAGVVVAALGAGGLAAGAVFGLLAQSAWTKATGECNAASCSAAIRPQAESDRRVAVRDGTFSTIGLVAGGVLFAGGITLFVASPFSRAPARSAAVRVTPTGGPASLGLDLRGDF